jgi:hypothetical protein
MAIKLILLGGFYEKEELFARVSEADADRVLEHKWRADPRSHTTYAKTNISAVNKDGVRYRTTVFLHRFIAQPPEQFETHHKDADGLHCTRGNLENVPHSINLSNRRPYGEVDFYGVSKHRRKFSASITYKGRSLYLGVYPTAMEAAQVFDAKARELYGPFVRVNFPLDGGDDE